MFYCQSVSLIQFIFCWSGTPKDISPILLKRILKITVSGNFSYFFVLCSFWRPIPLKGRSNLLAPLMFNTLFELVTFHTLRNAIFEILSPLIVATSVTAVWNTLKFFDINQKKLNNWINWLKIPGTHHNPDLERWVTLSKPQVHIWRFFKLQLWILGGK